MKSKVKGSYYMKRSPDGVPFQLTPSINTKLSAVTDGME